MAKSLAAFLNDTQAMVGEVDVSWTQALSALQGLLGVVRGAIGEIGVHHGAYLAVLAALATPDEPLWACDLFEDLQGLNLDKSGRGNRADMLRAVHTRSGREDVEVVPRPSYELLRQRIAPPLPFRMLSVDGSRMAINAFTDLVWATQHMAHGGLLAIHDVASARWLGPARAMRSYWHLHDPGYNFLPLIMTPKKLWLVSRTWHANYSRAIEKIAREPTLTAPARHASFREFVACLNSQERKANRTTDHAPLWLPPPPKPLPQVWLVRRSCQVGTAFDTIN